jgi:hypothetical protein
MLQCFRARADDEGNPPLPLADIEGDALSHAELLRDLDGGRLN